MLTMKLTWAVALAVGWCCTPAPGAPAIRLAAELTDGSRLVGHPKLEKWPLESSLGRIEIASSLLSSVEFTTNGQARLLMQNGDRLQGTVQLAKLELETIFGPVALPLNQVRRILVLADPAHQPAGLILYYTFDEPGEKIRDVSGHDRNGVLVGSHHNLQEGRRGGSASVQDRVGEITVENSARLPLTEFTLAIWIKRANAQTTSGGPWHCALFADRGRGGLMGLETDGRLYMGQQDGTRRVSTARIADTEWHHVATVRRQGSAAFYVDGRKVDEIELPTHLEVLTGLSLGSIGQRIGYPFVGAMDEVMVFDRPLSEEEIKSLAR